MKSLPVIIASALLLSGCGWANLNDVKEKAPAVWDQAGFKIVGYEGFQWCNWWGGSYGGACVWHTVRRNPDNGIIYHGYIHRWGGEYHIYNIRAIDAIKPK